MKISLLAKKGGVGKSTLTLLLYEALRQAGKNVSVRDWDAQGTTTKSLELLNPQRSSSAEASGIVIYDTPPNLEHTAVPTAVRNSDIILVVTTPSPADIWEAQEALLFATSRNPTAITRLVFNKIRRSTILGRLAESESGQNGTPTLGARISSRECYQHALAQGWKALDGTAREEVLQFGLAVLSLYTP